MREPRTSSRLPILPQSPPLEGQGKRRVAQAGRQNTMPHVRRKGTEVTRITVTWKASDKRQKQEYAETGERPDARRKFTLDLKELSQETRKPIVEHLGLHCFTLGMEHTHDFHKEMPASAYLPGYSQDYDHQPTMRDILSYVALEADARNEAREHKTKIDAAKKANWEQLQAAYDKLRLQVDALIESGDLAALEAFNFFPVNDIASFKPSGGRSNLYKLWLDAIKTARKAKRKASKKAWIEAHGSDHLKRAHAGGYDAQRLYVTERASAEAPEFTVDFDEKAEWQVRTCPSPRALDAEAEAEALGIGEEVKVVWLKKAAVNSVAYDERDCYDGFGPCEAVVIHTYLSKYDLVQEL